MDEQKGSDEAKIESGGSGGAALTWAQRIAALWARIAPKATHPGTLAVVGVVLIGLPILWRVFGALVHWGLIAAGAVLVAWGAWRWLYKVTANFK